MSRPSGQASAGARSRGASASRPSRHRAAGSPHLLSLLLSILPLSAPTLGAQSSEELRTGIARDVGDIAILEYDGPGSTYDARLEDGTLNVEARTRVGLRFYETHPDTYDGVNPIDRSRVIRSTAPMASPSGPAPAGERPTAGRPGLGRRVPGGDGARVAPALAVAGGLAGWSARNVRVNWDILTRVSLAVRWRGVGPACGAPPIEATLRAA